jgi:flagellar basal-body rod protein FlgB
MMQEFEGVTLGVLRLALDAASLRHQVVAHNIANANTQGYTPVRVNFEEQFDSLRGALGRSQSVDPELLEHLRPVVEQDRNVNGQTAQVALDLEVAKLAQNTVHYQALLRGVSKYLSIVGVAVTEGKH